TRFSRDWSSDVCSSDLEVEAMFYRHPDVQEACIIATRDAYRGESVKLVAVLRPQSVGRVDADTLIAWAREHMAAYKVPREVAFRSEERRVGKECASRWT